MQLQRWLLPAFSRRYCQRNAQAVRHSYPGRECVTAPQGRQRTAGLNTGKGSRTLQEKSGISSRFTVAHPKTGDGRSLQLNPPPRARTKPPGLPDPAGSRREALPELPPFAPLHSGAGGAAPPAGGGGGLPADRGILTAARL